MHTASTPPVPPLGEFQLIRRYFTRAARHAVLGIGDDCALLAPTPGMQMAVSTDMLVEGRHFFPDVDPYALGHKALAVNLSDLAACGAQPRYFTLSLALAHADPQWLEPFSQGLLALADAHGCELIGGDTTKGPLTISITVFGDVPPGQALLRSGARPGDDIYVSGTLGDAFLALQERRGTLQLAPVVRDMARGRMERPTPRVALGLALRAIASSAADISDGLLGDLGHILQRSAVGATIDTELAIQLLAAKSLYTGATAHFDTEIGDGLALQCVLSGGDDYELVFTAPPQARPAVQVASGHSGVGVTRIGTIEPQAGLRLVDGKGEAVENCFASFDHFL